MTEKLPPIYFYLPQCEDLADNMPDSAETFMPGFSGGVYAWTLQTYLRLKADGFPCELVGTMPAEGIVLAHRDSLPIDLQPGPRLLIVCLLADKERHLYAQFHIVSNREEKMLKKSGTIWQSYYMPHWRQPGLIPRNSARGDRFENVAYFGHERNLAPELKEPSWHKQLNELGLHFQVVDRLRWNDYSDVDAILAVRSFNNQDYTSKPATKLFNSWHAGVPAILGRETSFQTERQSELDYIEVTSLNDVLAVLKRLRDDKEWRHAMVENGFRRAEETQPEMVVKRWRSFITEVAVPAYERWCNASNWTRQSLLQRQFISLKIIRMKNRLHSWKRQIKGALSYR
ncbi:hypothetical protein [Argonema galeatum]|uniref:hypothetical protein n=1 Tax=Argonema galeatum TaxID=2942762 RepID=UPI002012FEB7|nr:hypothetical protein [Argonema galeatum]MCL1463324.1 hypothetical protein [Argonema galeatum A003/A1]